ncbi:MULTISPECIES: DUF5658 family protein [Bacillaceae]|uniref:DUF5658 domain-containing protein n=1 Tax=Evansella alkalicola TaxID=745819 RepID=A0ABS6JPZ9_9BACI|nr:MULTISPECIES: DUF5658 family protein [Bacillaceae]MBU9720643.1 hypothetical protein [Bacillus alkalicola]
MGRINALILFYIIAVLNILDMIFTGIGLHFRFIEEGNILMRIVWENHPLYFYILKTTLSIALILLGHVIRNVKISRVTNVISGGALLLYMSVMFLHLYVYLQYLYR